MYARETSKAPWQARKVGGGGWGRREGQRRGERDNSQAESEAEWTGTLTDCVRRGWGEKGAPLRKPAGDPGEGLLQNLGLFPALLQGLH